MDSKTSNFIKHITTECKKYGIKTDISPTKYLVLTEEGYTKVSGYFDYSNKILRVASDKPLTKWLPILTHEYCHFLQWKENCDIWKKSLIGSRKKDSSTIVFEWVSGKSFREETLNKSFNLARDVELDCERRTCNIIKKYNLPIDIKKYIQKANAYVHLYNWVRINRRWYTARKPPYDNSKIWKKMPTTLYGNYDKTSKRILDLFDKYC